MQHASQCAFFLCLWLVMWSTANRKNPSARKSAEKHRKASLFRRKGWLSWSCWADSNRRPHPYQLIGSPGSAAVQRFRGVFVAEGHGLWLFSVHWFRSLVSPCGSACGSIAQFAICRTGLTRLNFTARSGVVSGHSSSKVKGLVEAPSKSVKSSGVKAK